MTEDSPKWISKVQVLRIHELQIERHGGFPGLRAGGLLESAMARPQNHYVYGETDVFVLAALYAGGIAQNHPFKDGNKRTAHATADLFLYIHGYDLEVGDVAAHVAFFERVASGSVSREELAKFYRETVRAL